MKLILQSPAKMLLPAYRVQNVERGKLERFKTELARLLDHLEHSAEESEEHLKNIVSDFLKGAFYRGDHFVNTKDRKDLVIHHGRTSKDPVGVIIEAKRPGNKGEMMAPDKPNTKALHELLRYYLGERSRADNREIRHLIITDIYTWYLFDAADFERHIYSNNKLLRQFTEWSEGRHGAGNTDWFYKEVAAPFFEKELPELRCCRFDLRDYIAAATNADPADDDTLLDLYKILSPEHLLKKAFSNDSNTLNKQFYDELLYILGLEEMKEGGKKLIDRAGKRRHDGSLLENTLAELEAGRAWRDLNDLDQFGDTPETQRFSIALELCITWLNRILFLKLLEGQLLRWSPGAGRLLSPEKVRDFDELNELFFQVLAVPEAERRQSATQKFAGVPYLNSSLFEQTELESRTLRISALKDRLDLPIAPNTVLLDGAGKRREGRMNTLHYLFAFLDAYDFSSDAKARVQADNRDVINASVLGLIFEKINGYRDGSFFTPGFITMYMCRETLRRAVLHKFNERYGWDCQNLETELYNEILRQRIPPAAANELVNSLRICDPAVGSGHFLVSALNELIAIKSDLGILCDRQGKILPLRAVLGNDELILTDPDTDSAFEYRPGLAASQRIQETLFHEKQTLIENCLFGVDINPKSVMICRLRLWIELLKHAYFTAESQYRQLETLPNIDINIKAGNSLVSRFALDEDLSEVFRRQRFSRQDYLTAVQAYKNARDRDAKEKLRTFIEQIKHEFRQTVYNRNPFAKQLSQKRGQLVLLDNNLDLFGEAKKDEATVKKESAKLKADIAELERQLEEYKTGPLYRNSFEWRFEFPEVLDETGKYAGFDVVVGNPPYIRQEELAPFKSHFQAAFETYAGTADLYVYFVERGLKILRPGGQFCYILPNKWMRAGYGDKLRQFVKRHRIESIGDFGDLPVFEEATTYPCILELSRAAAKPVFRAANIDTLSYDTSLSDYLRAINFTVSLDRLEESSWAIKNTANQELLDKIKIAGIPLEIYVEDLAFRGITSGFDAAYVINKEVAEQIIKADAKAEKYVKKYLIGRDVQRFIINDQERFFLFIPWDFDLPSFPSIEKHLLNFKDELSSRPEVVQGRFPWYALSRYGSNYYQYFEDEKIVYQKFQVRPLFAIDTEGCCLNSALWFIPKRDYFLLGFLNSKIGWLLISNYCTEIQNGYQLIWQYLGKIPIARASDIQKQPIISLVTRILAAKQSDPQADTGALEAELDGLVYGLYGLTEEEIGIVEGGAI